MIAPFGLTIDQFATLAKLHRLGPAMLPDLAEMMAMDRATLSYTLKDLVARDIVTATRSLGDGRRRIVAITEAGLPLFLEAKACWEAVNTQIDAALGAGALALRHLLKQIETLDLHVEPPAPSLA